MTPCLFLFLFHLLSLFFRPSLAAFHLLNSTTWTSAVDPTKDFTPAVDSTGNPIVSQNSIFALGFSPIKNSPANSTSYLLSVIIGYNLNSSTASPVPIWTANREKPARETGHLRFSGDRKLVLDDGTGSTIAAFGASKALSMGLLDNGNLQVYNTTNSSLAIGDNVIWQSWDLPTDTLVTGQVLHTGSQLVGNLSDGNSSSGPYSMVPKPGGLVFYIEKEAYLTVGLAGTELSSNLAPCFYNSSLSETGAQAKFTGNSFEIYISANLTNSSSCVFAKSKTVFNNPSPNNTDDYRFLRLDYDGNLRIYTLDPSPDNPLNLSLWMFSELINPDDLCDLPMSCGQYGLCRNKQCSCPGSGTLDQFEQMDGLDVAKGCEPRSPLSNCTGESDGSDDHLLPLPGYDYFLNDLNSPETHTDEADCQSICLKDCDCKAVFYRNMTGACFPVREEIRTLKAADNQTFKAYLRVSKWPEQGTRSLTVGQIAGITVGSASAALFLCLIIVVFYKKSASNSVPPEEEVEVDPEEAEEEAFFKTLPGLPPRFSYEELRISTDGFRRKLGSGGFGIVYEGVLPDSTPVAVKRLGGSGQGFKEFRAEVATIGSLSHINLVRLCGFCADKGKRLLVYEFMSNGSLDSWLFQRNEGGESNSTDSSRFLTWEQRYGVALGTARGLAYLHEGCREPVLHLDVKPQNILLDRSFVPKVSDFGLSRLLGGGETRVYTAVRGTPGYLAPEWLRHSLATKGCDVYSYGMVLLELVSGRRNFEPEMSDPRLCYFPAWAMLRAMEGRHEELVDPKLRLHVGDNILHVREAVRVLKVGLWCIQEDPKDRPSMVEVVKMIQGEWHVPEAPLWLIERGPQFLEAYGYDNVRMDDDERSSCTLLSSVDVSGPR
ncbi:hypothetical protein AMTRI_Chr03g148490 [Amborella trichopoda]